MNLEDFVASSIDEIVGGIKAAQDRLNAREIPAAVNPVWSNDGLGKDNIGTIEFDVAVTVANTNRSETGGGIKLGIQVLGADIGTKGQDTSERTSVSRVRFSVRFVPPSTVIDQGDKWPKHLNVPNAGIV